MTRIPTLVVMANPPALAGGCSVSPSIGFAVNADVTLNMGWQWRNVSAAKHNSQTTGLRQTLTDLNIGAGWGLSKKSTVIFNVKTNISGGLGSELGINWVFKL